MLSVSPQFWCVTRWFLCFVLLEQYIRFANGVRSEQCDLFDKSTKYVEECGHKPSHVYPLLITGTGRSATQFTATILQHIGIDVSHDNHVHPLTGEDIRSTPLRDGAVSWPFAFSDKSHPAWAGDLKGARFSKVFLQVRNPLKVIGSRYVKRLSPDTIKFVGRHISLPSGYVAQAKASKQSHFDDLRFALHYWLNWNKFVLEIADWWYRVEEMDPSMICLKAGTMPKEKCPSEKEASVLMAHMQEQSINHVTEYDPVTWPLLFALDYKTAKLAKEFACKLGYDCEIPEPEKGGEDIVEYWYPHPLAICTTLTKANAPILPLWVAMQRLLGVRLLYVQADGKDKNMLLEDPNIRALSKNVYFRHFVHFFHSMEVTSMNNTLKECFTANPMRSKWVGYLSIGDYMITVADKSNDNIAKAVGTCTSLTAITLQSGSLLPPSGMVINAMCGHFTSIIHPQSETSPADPLCLAAWHMEQKLMAKTEITIPKCQHDLKGISLSSNSLTRHFDELSSNSYFVNYGAQLADYLWKICDPSALKGHGPPDVCNHISEHPNVWPLR